MPAHGRQSAAHGCPTHAETTDIRYRTIAMSSSEDAPALVEMRKTRACDSELPKRLIRIWRFSAFTLPTSLQEQKSRSSRGASSASQCIELY